MTTAAVNPTLSAVGAFTASTAAATTNSAFSYAVSGYSADEAATATVLANTTAQASPATQFGVQSGRFTDTVGGGAITIGLTGTVGATQATSVGATVSAVASTSLDNGLATISFQRSGSATNAQTSFSAERQASSASMSGDGVNTVVLSSLGDAAVGVAATVTDGSALLPTGGAFSLNKTVVAGQNSADLLASNTSVTQPGYGISSNTFGGTTQAALGVFTVNGMTVNTAGSTAGTSASLTAVSSFSVFAK